MINLEEIAYTHWSASFDSTYFAKQNALGFILAGENLASPIR
jgi:hypothetical protein